MAVTTDPFWVSRLSGIAPRNGTSDHTITLGPTRAGSFLVLIVFGAVTHSVADANWTERLQPVSSGELSVFTRVAAGNDSVTITHNASNYPVLWVFYEFPAGSTYTAGIGSNPASETFPTLSGLPGTEQVIIAARGVAVASATTTAYTTWTHPFNEDYDDYAPGTPTDGGVLTVGRLINQTATSITPAAVTTPSTAFINSDREYVVFAINAQPLNFALTGVPIADMNVSGALNPVTLTYKLAGSETAVSEIAVKS